MNTGGWTGVVLRIDLTTGRIVKEPLNMEWAKTYVGGRGLAAKYLYEEMDPAADPLGPANKLIFATGPMTGTNASTSSRFTVVTKGALTGAITTSNSGGTWGPELKFAGYDLLIFEGKAPRPSFIWIYNDEVEIRDAGHLWGKTVWETDDEIREEVGVHDSVVSCIGPAGENLVRFACIVNDRHRAAGRSGVGAVMGSKNLKAVAVRGTGGVSIANSAAFMNAMWVMKKKIAEHPICGQGLAAYGTAVLVNVINESGALPTNNHLLSQLEDADNISGETLAATRLVSNKACFGCTMACGRVSHLPGEAQDKFMVTTRPHNWRIAVEGPEYENAWAMGADCGINDLDALIKANALCNELGMDPISFGATLAAAMELYEKSVIGDAQTGMPFKFGSGDALVAMAEATAYRDGFGHELAEGSKRMTAKFGHPEFFMGVRGQEFPAYDARAIQGMGLGYATSNRGACHLKSYTVAPEILGIPTKMDPAVTEGKAEITKIFQDATSTVDSTGLCIFLTFGVGLEEMQPQLAAVTGVNYTVNSLLQAGERIWNLERMWNQKAGFTGKDDTLPKRLLEEPIPEGPTKGQVNRLHEMLPEYYKLRGWTPDGVPTNERLAALGL
ncbi:MAG: aldehyde ferredoxin oxidoreductase family protein [candidate division Zixibacteria bacterium]|nr:aldehyde ferredoxin oxidoreductase family protein [candidate division Zixibacteria bacterium]